MSKKTKNKKAGIDLSVFAKPTIKHSLFPNDIPATITLPARQFKRYIRLGSEKAAIERQQKTIREKWEKAGLLPVASESTVGQFVIGNENGDEQGKATVYYFSGAVIPASYRLKIS